MKAFKVKHWNHILIEGYCMINNEYLHKHSKWVYGWEGNEYPENRGKKPNPDYDPAAQPDEKPEYCAGHVCINCLLPEKICEHLAFCGVEKKLKKKFAKVVHKLYTD